MSQRVLDVFLPRQVGQGRPPSGWDGHLGQTYAVLVVRRTGSGEGLGAEGDLQDDAQLLFRVAARVGGTWKKKEMKIRIIKTFLAQDLSPSRT